MNLPSLSVIEPLFWEVYTEKFLCSQGIVESLNIAISGFTVIGNVCFKIPWNNSYFNYYKLYELKNSNSTSSSIDWKCWSRRNSRSSSLSPSSSLSLHHVTTRKQFMIKLALSWSYWSYSAVVVCTKHI